MTVKRVMLAFVSAVLLASCDGGSLSVRAEGADRVMVQLPMDSIPRDITIWQETDSGKSTPYFEGHLSDRLPRDGRIMLPRDLVLFDYAKTGPSFDPVRFPKGKYTVNFFVNAEHAYEQQFEIR